MWQGCKGKREGDSIGAQEREGRARKERIGGNTCEAVIVFSGLKFLLRLDPELKSGLRNTSKTKTYSLDRLG